MGLRTEGKRPDREKEISRGISFHEPFHDFENERIPAERGVPGADEGSHGFAVQAVPAEQEGLQRGVPEGVSLGIGGAVAKKRREIGVSVEEDGEDEGKGGVQREELDEGEAVGGEGPARGQQSDEGGHVEEVLHGLRPGRADAGRGAEAVGRGAGALRSTGEDGGEHLQGAVREKVVGRGQRNRQEGPPIGFAHVERTLEPRGDLRNGFQKGR